MAWFHSFNGWVIVHCIYAPHLYPFPCPRTFRLLPVLAVVTVLQWTLGAWILWLHAQEWDCRLKCCVCVHAKLLQLCPALSMLWIVARQAPLSMRFSRQEYWSGLPCPPPGDLPDPGIDPCVSWGSYIAGRFYIAEPSEKPFRLLW